MAKNIVKKSQSLEIKGVHTKKIEKKIVEPVSEIKEVTKSRKKGKTIEKPFEEKNNILENNKGDE